MWSSEEGDRTWTVHERVLCAPHRATQHSRMSEPAIRKCLGGLDVADWRQILDCVPIFTIAVDTSPSGGRLLSRHDDLDAVRQWTRSPSLSGGLLVEVVDLYARSLVRKLSGQRPDQPPDLPVNDQGWSALVDQVHAEFGRGPALICSFAAREAGADQEHLLADAVRRAEWPPNVQDSPHAEEPTVAQEPPTPKGEVVATALRELVDAMRSVSAELAQVLRNAAEAVTAGRTAYLDPDAVDGWNRSMDALRASMDLFSSTGEPDFDVIETEVARREVEARLRRELEEEERRKAQERVDEVSRLHGEVEALEKQILQATHYAKPGLELARSGVLDRLAELSVGDPVADESPAGESVADEPAADEPAVDETVEEEPLVDGPVAARPEQDQPGSDVSGVASGVEATDLQSQSDPVPGRPGTAGESAEALPELLSPAVAPSAPTRPDDEPVLVELIDSGQFAAAWWVAAARDENSVLCSVLRYAAGAFATGQDSVDAAEVLSFGHSIDLDAVVASPELAAITVASTARAGLVAGWGEYMLLDQMFTGLKLDQRWMDLLNLVVPAIRQEYVHPVGHSSTELTITKAEIAKKVETLEEGLKGGSIKLARGTAILRHLLRSQEPLGLALTAVREWAAGNSNAADLGLVLVQLNDRREVDRMINNADLEVSSPKQRKKAVTAGALTQLYDRIDQVKKCVAEALHSESQVTRTGTGVSHAESYRKIRDAAEATLRIEHSDRVEDVVLGRLRAWLLKPESPLVESGKDLGEVLLNASMVLGEARRDDRGFPLIAVLDSREVACAMMNPPSGVALFNRYLERGDFRSAHFFKAEVSDFSEQLRAAGNHWRDKLNTAVRSASDVLDNISAYSAMAHSTLQEFEARIVEIDLLKNDRTDLSKYRFDVSMELFDQISADLRQVQDETKMEMRNRLGALRNLSPDSVTRVEKLIESHDLATAQEFLSFLKMRQELPSEDYEDLRFLESFREFVGKLDGNRSSVHEVADVLGGPVEGSSRSEGGLEAWRALTEAPRPRASVEHLRGVLRLVGLDVLGQPENLTERGRTGFSTFRVRARPTDGSYVPELGSKTKHYLVTVVYEHKDPGLVLEMIPSQSRRGPNIILYTGVISNRDRGEYLVQSRRRRVSVLIVDTACAAYMAAREPGSFLALQRITLPYTVFPHYAPYVAGDVPDEVFVGRRSEMEDISSAAGSLFVYGGRQLGKSALLHRVERDVNRTEGHVAIFIDLKARGIGEFNEPEHLWSVLLDELKERGIVPAKFSSQLATAVVGHIKKWLAAEDSRRMLLLLDEADLFLEGESRERRIGNRMARFPNVGPLKELMDTSGRRFKPVFAGLHQVQRLQNISNTPLAHGGRDVLIGPLRQSDARRLVVRPLSALGYRFESLDLVWRLLAFTNYQAGLIQIACHALVEHLQERHVRVQEPPVMITAKDVDAVTADNKVRTQIAQRFRLTIALEDRYFVTALVLSVLSLEDRFREYYSPEELLGWCRMYWRGGFDNLTTAEFQLYLHEMVGLGVLVTRPDERFAMRSPNVVTMLGSQDELVQQLEEGGDRFDLPHDYNPRATRRLLAIPGVGDVRSPLSEHDLGRLLPITGQASAAALVVVGSKTLGLDRVPGVLQTVANDRGPAIRLLRMADLDQVRIRGAHRSGDRPLTVVVADSADEADTLRALVEVTRAVDQKLGRRAVVVGPSGSGALLTHDDKEIEVVSLRRWTSEGLRAWNENPFAGRQDRERLLEATGGWPELVEQAVAAVETGATFDQVLDAVSQFPETSAVARQFVEDVGLIALPEFDAVRAWADVAHLGDSISRVDLAELLELNRDQFDALLVKLDWLDVLSDNEEELCLEQIIHRALRRMQGAVLGSG